MGTWGHGPFDNDVAADVLDTLAGRWTGSRAVEVDRLLRSVVSGADPLDADVAAEGVAAAAVVVASVVAGADLVDPDELPAVAVPVSRGRWARAGAAVRALQERPGETDELWEESGGLAEYAGMLQRLSDALAGPRPRLTVHERLAPWTAGLRGRRRDTDQDVDESRHPDVVYAVAGPDSRVFALAAADGGEVWRYSLFALVPGSLPAPQDLTLESAVWQMSTVERFATDGVALYDGTAASVEAALRWAPELPEPLAEWLRETVELADLMGERLVPWS